MDLGAFHLTKININKKPKTKTCEPFTAKKKYIYIFLFILNLKKKKKKTIYIQTQVQILKFCNFNLIFLLKKICTFFYIKKKGTNLKVKFPIIIYQLALSNLAVTILS